MEITGTQIKNLITKFYYKNNNLCFQILLLLDQNKSVAYEEYVDYSAYKKAYNELMDIKTKNLSLFLPTVNIETAPLSFA